MSAREFSVVMSLDKVRLLEYNVVPSETFPLSMVYSRGAHTFSTCKLLLK